MSFRKLYICSVSYTHLTILVIAIRTKAKTKHISPICQFVISNIPNDVAIPFPPLNPKNIGKVCPTTTKIPASCTNKALSTFCTIFPTSKAIPIATTPFKISQISVISAAFFPTDLRTLVVPAFPLPFCLTSNPATFLLIIIEKLRCV